MKLAFASLGCPEWTVERIAVQARTMGYDGVELRGVSGEHLGPDEPPERRAAIRRLFQAQRVEIAAVMGYTNFTAGDPAVRMQTIAVTEAMIRLCADLGCPILRVFGGKQPDGIDRAQAIAWVAEGLEQVAEMAARHRVIIAIETHDDWCRGERLREVLERVGRPQIGVCWDVANSWFEEPPEQTWERLGRWVRHVHFKDAKRGPDNRIRSVWPGEGEVDLAAALRLLRRDGYTGYLSFEWEKKWQPELPGPEAAFPYFLQYVRSMLERLN